MPTVADSPTPLPTMNLHDLESELLGLAGHIAAAECRFLQLLAEFDDRGGWAGVGIRSCAHWLSWRAGMSVRTASEHLRVAHALTHLPRITAAFAAGTISYSKVRAITRVTGSDDALLARIAATAGVDATITSPDLTDAEPAPDSADRGTADPGAAPGPTGPGDTGPGDTDHRGPDDGDPEPAPTGDSSSGSPTRTARSGAPTVADPDTAEQVLLDLALSGTASHVETVVRAVRRHHTPPADIAVRRTLTWYHDADGSLVLRGRLTPEDGAVLIAAIEARVAPPPGPARDRHTVRPADLHERILEQEPGPSVDRLGTRRCDALVDLARHHDDVSGPDETPGPTVARGDTHVVVHLDAGAGTARIVDGPEIPAPTAERLACDARAQALLEDRAGNRLYLGRSRRLASPAQIAALTVRDGGRCRFPGCRHTRHLHAHHIRHWLRGGRTDVDNLLLLCSYHHRIVHDHRYRIRHRPGGGWDVLRPDGTPVPAAGEPLDGHPDALVEFHTRAGLEIDRNTLTPDWYGDRLDPEPVLDALIPPRPTPMAA